MTLREQLILVADAFGTARKIGRQRVSTLFLNRGSTLDGLAAGAVDVTTGTFERVMARFSAEWPDGTPWPDGVSRPTGAMPEPAE